MKLYLNSLPKFEEIKWRKISDEEYDRLKNRFPHFSYDLCPTCGGKKQYKYRGEIWVCDCKTQIALTRHYLFSNIGRTYHTLGLDDLRDDKGDLKEMIETYISKWDSYKRYGRGILFHGPMGTGKTLAQVLILKELVKKGEKCWFTSFGSAINAYIDPDEKKAFFTEIREADCIAIDEVPPAASEKQREFFEEVLEWLVRYRVENSMPVLLGTNIDMLEARYPRVASLVSMAFVDFKVDGEDSRRTSSRINVDELIENEESRPVK